MRHRNKIIIGVCFFGILTFLVAHCHDCLANRVDRKVRQLLNQAEAYNGMKAYPQAIAVYNRAIKLQPNNLSLYYGRATSWGKMGNYINAIRDFTTVIKHDRSGENNKPRFPHAWRFRADCFMALGYLSNAMADYSRFLRFSPKDGKVWSYLAEAYYLMGRRELALQAIQRGLETGPHWSKKLRKLQLQVLKGEKITPHKPLSN
jgi:tetratricopeptide (TPR) repeat protein